MKLSKAQVAGLKEVESGVRGCECSMRWSTMQRLLSLGLIEFIRMNGLKLTPEGRKALEEARNGK